MRQIIFRMSLFLLLLSGMTIDLHRGCVSLTAPCLYACDPLNEDGGDKDPNPGSGSSSGSSTTSSSTNYIQYIYDNAGNRITRKYVSYLQSKGESRGREEGAGNAPIKVDPAFTTFDLLAEYINGNSNAIPFLYYMPGNTDDCKATKS